MKRIAINGFGRIGRNFLRVVLQDPVARKALNVVAINIGPSHPDYVAHLFKYDSIMGTYAGDVQMRNNVLIIDGHEIALIAEADPRKAPWQQYAIDWVVEASGHFTHREGAQKHLDAGAKKVLITAPAHDEDVAIVPGVNDAAYQKDLHTIVSLGSCTTNAIVPLCKVLHDAFGIEAGIMTTVHAYTNTQVLLDVEGEDLRRSRAAALNIIPTTTGASQMFAKTFPALADKIVGCAMRVPVAKVSIVDFAFTAQKTVSVAALNEACKAASQGEMKQIFGYSTEPLVSSDYSGTNYSVVVDGLMTQAVGGVGKVFGWYDNEWGYSCRLKDFLLQV